MDPNVALRIYTLEYDRDHGRDDLAEPIVRDALMDALVMSNRAELTREFEDWLHDHASEFIPDILRPQGRSTGEIIDRWRLRWVEHMLVKYDLTTLNRWFRLEVL